MHRAAMRRAYYSSPHILAATVPASHQGGHSGVCDQAESSLILGSELYGRACTPAPRS